MKKILYFLMGTLLMATAFLSLMISGVIFDTGAKMTVEPKFFQTNDNHQDRPGVPASPADFGDNKMRDLLIAKYITELFYVTPDTTETQRRIKGQSSLARLSSKQVFNKWREYIAPEIEEISKNGGLRTVSIISISPRKGSDNYWTITYALKTWDVPNDFSVEPRITQNIVDMHIIYKPGLRSKDSLGGYTVTQYLERENADPSAVFKFLVQDIIFQENLAVDK